MRGPKSQKGASLIEAMVAAGLTAAAALTVYPIVFESKKIIRHSDFYDQCINAARSKLNEYKTGQSVDFSTLTVPYDSLTAETASAQTVPSGFAYAKVRYNLENAAYCPVTGTPFQVLSVPTLPPANLANLGRRECVAGLGCPTPVTPLSNCKTQPTTCVGVSPVDDQMLQNTAGRFKLFVNLRRYNATVGLNGALAPTEDCITTPHLPTYNAAPDSTPIYDFQQAGDMIKVTVTGVVDMSGTPGAVFAGITQGTTREQELTCQVSDFIRPYSHIARYWLQDDGHVYRWLGTGQTGNQWEVFKSLASPGNLGVVVSPDNSYLFALRQGSLIRYSNCAGEPIDCDPSTQQTWLIPNNIVSISAKFTGVKPHQPNAVCGDPDETRGLPIVFGLLADRKTAVCINLPIVDLPIAGGSPVDIVATKPAAIVPDQVGARIPFQVPQDSSRVHSIFTDSHATSAYVVDLTCSQDLLAGVGTNNTYCGGIYSANDLQMMYPLEVFTVRAIAFSK